MRETQTRSMLCLIGQITAIPLSSGWPNSIDVTYKNSFAVVPYGPKQTNPRHQVLLATGPEFPSRQGQVHRVDQKQYGNNEGEQLGLRRGKYDPLADTRHGEEQDQPRHHIKP